MSSEDYVYGHILEALSGGLYPNKLDVIREYLQNSYDAIREKIRKAETEEERKKLLTESKITITIKGGSLFIHDNGTGMDFQTLNEYRKIGFSRKPFGEFAGWRGIGKAAGLAITEKLIVTTSKGQGEMYQLTLEANNMLKEVYKLRAEGKNIPFNELIDNYSSIKTIDGGNEACTTVELCKVKPEASELLNKNRLIAHLTMIAPVPFRPEFKHSEEIQKELESAIENYTPMNLYVEQEKVYKPYIEEWETEDKSVQIEQPKYVAIYDEEKENLIAFCWYCMHSDRGQIKADVMISGEPVSVCGLVYRMHDIKIGDAYLTRRTLWPTTPERSLWALGEVHILDERVEPTSDRNDFLDNHARYMLYEQCREIAKEISRRAGKLSEESRAEEKIKEADTRIKEISSEVASKRVPKLVVPAYIYEATALKKEAEKRKPKTPEEELKQIADNVISSADEVLQQLTESLTKTEKEHRVYTDLVDDLGMSAEGKLIYDTLMRTLKDYFANDPKIFEELVRRINRALEDAFTS